MKERSKTLRTFIITPFVVDDPARPSLSMAPISPPKYFFHPAQSTEATASDAKSRISSRELRTWSTDVEACRFRALVNVVAYALMRGHPVNESASENRYDGDRTSDVSSAIIVRSRQRRVDARRRAPLPPTTTTTTTTTLTIQTSSLLQLDENLVLDGGERDKIEMIRECTFEDIGTRFLDVPASANAARQSPAITLNSPVKSSFEQASTFAGSTSPQATRAKTRLWHTPELLGESRLTLITRKSAVAEVSRALWKTSVLLFIAAGWGRAEDFSVLDSRRAFYRSSSKSVSDLRQIPGNLSFHWDLRRIAMSGSRKRILRTKERKRIWKSAKYGAPNVSREML
ncbi:hypothetical protein SCHPADRAFT_930645, partial [Schizopora paradoxa]